MSSAPSPFHYHDTGGRNRGCRQCQRESMQTMAKTLAWAVKHCETGLDDDRGVADLATAIDNILDSWPRRG